MCLPKLSLGHRSHGSICMGAILLAALFGPSVLSQASLADRPNVLMIWVDDLRPEIGAYGVDRVTTPGLNRLARRSVRFDRAYCNVPVCGASRASVMTGIRGTPTRFRDYDTRIEVDAPDVDPLHRHFRNNGYYTAFAGKVLHFSDDSAGGWIEGQDHYQWPGYTNPENQRIYEERLASGTWRSNGPPWERSDGPDDAVSDGRIANDACEIITRLAETPEPFFLAIGFFKPHLPFVAPKKYWPPHSDSAPALPDNFATRPKAPDFAFSNWGELRSYAGMPVEGPVSEQTARQLITAYHACVTFTDAQIDRVLDALDESPAAENTIVVLLGDHGWNLGEHGMWCKHCCFETSMRVPFLVSAPGLEGFAASSVTESPTEMIDIYPSLCDLAGLSHPPQLAGKSFVSVLRDPSHHHDDTAVGRFMNGDTLRTDRYRYTLYRNGEKTIGQMLYDHTADPQENVNLAQDDEHRQVVERLRNQLLAEIKENSMR